MPGSVVSPLVRQWIRGFFLEVGVIRGDGDLDSSVPRLPNRRHSLRNRVAPSVLQEDRALDACEAEWPEAVAEIRLLALTGCRRSEVLNLRWRDIGNDSIKLLDSKTGPRTVPCVFSHAGPRPPRVAPIINPSREGHRAPLKARRTSSSTHPQSSCRVSLSKTEAGWQSSSSRHRAIAHSITVAIRCHSLPGRLMLLVPDWKQHPSTSAAAC